MNMPEMVRFRVDDVSFRLILHVLYLPRDAMLSRVLAVVVCLSVCLPACLFVRPSATERSVVTSREQF